MTGNLPVSVLMPCYNASKYIGTAIESVLGQSFRDLELVIAEDRSTDNTWEIVQSYAAKDPRIRIAQNRENLRIAKNRNRLLELARGKYIAWQDADDISEPLRIEHQIAFLDAHPEVGIVGGWLRFFTDADPEGFVRKYAPDDARLRAKIYRYSPVAQPGAMIPKKVLDEMGEYKSEFDATEDLDMSFRIGAKYRFANLQEVVIRYRENISSATFTRLPEMERKTFAIRKLNCANPAYRLTFGDRLYNLLQWISMFIIPPRWKISLFHFIRNLGNR
jgi:glycosyltransferase involved in cell wall biosynthesis